MTRITDFTENKVCRFEIIIRNLGHKPPAISVIKVIKASELLPNFVKLNFKQLNIPHIFVGSKQSHIWIKYRDRNERREDIRSQDRI